jgi:hypothetical protein
MNFTKFIFSDSDESVIECESIDKSIKAKATDDFVEIKSLIKEFEIDMLDGKFNTLGTAIDFAANV